MLLFNGSPIVWRSKKLKAIATSTAAAEYMAAFFAATDLVWARNVCAELGVIQSDSSVLYEDNRACIVMGNSLMIGEKAKHINIKFHYLRELVAQGTIRFEWCPTDDMAADFLTKALAPPRFLDHRQRLVGMKPSTAGDQGTVGPSHSVIPDSAAEPPHTLFPGCDVPGEVGPCA